MKSCLCLVGPQPSGLTPLPGRRNRSITAIGPGRAETHPQPPGHHPSCPCPFRFSFSSTGLPALWIDSPFHLRSPSCVLRAPRPPRVPVCCLFVVWEREIKCMSSTDLYKVHLVHSRSAMFAHIKPLATGYASWPPRFGAYIVHVPPKPPVSPVPTSSSGADANQRQTHSRSFEHPAAQNSVWQCGITPST
jgi:hypothetical protein